MAKGSNEPRPAASASERPHVLVVSSDEGLTEFLSEVLMYGGFWVSVVASGIQTLEVFRLRSFDLVLMDAALTGLPATDVIRRLRSVTGTDGEDRPRTDVPILVIAASEAEAKLEDVLESGADERLLAPLDAEELVPKLHGVVATWRLEHPGRPYADAAALLPGPRNDQ